MEEGASDLILFFGRFHPMILHLPIGFLVIGFVLEIFSRFDRFRQFKPAVGFVLLLGAFSSVVAAVLGFMLAQGGGYNEELLAVHQWSGIGVAVFSVIALGLYQQAHTKASAVLNKAYLSTMMVMLISLSIAGHYGGSLTHGSDYLTQYMPNNLRVVAGLPAKEEKIVRKITNLPEAVVYTDIIYPIFDARCVSCHNESKSKGDLQMHTVEALQKGGESGPLFVAGNPEESELLKRIHLPENHDEHMPPEGKTQLTEEQVLLLAWWIQEGASFDKKVAELYADDEVQKVLTTLADPEANMTEVEKLLATLVPPANAETLQQLRNQGLLVMPLAAEVHWLQINVPQSQPVDSLLPVLEKVAEQLTWLDLGGTTTTDQALTSISTFKKLTRLHLENTQITDAGLQHLKALSYLEYLNLYGTQVTDDGIQQLSSLKNLEKLYVWQTQVTTAGADKLKEALPALEINLGMAPDVYDTIKNTASTNTAEEKVNALSVNTP